MTPSLILPRWRGRIKEGVPDPRWQWEPVTDSWIAPGSLHLALQMGVRKRGGIFYTPPQLTSFLVQQALEPQVYNRTSEEGLTPTLPSPAGGGGSRRGSIKSPREILALTVCDPAMGSGAFLVQAVRYLADRLVEAWDAAAVEHPQTVLVMPYADPAPRALENYGVIPTDRAEATAWARRLVAERCIWGVDLNPLAVELAKLSIWLVSLSKDKPFTFLDHRLRHGNSLIGASFLKEIALENRERRRQEYRDYVETYHLRQIDFIPGEALQAPKSTPKDQRDQFRDLSRRNDQDVQQLMKLSIQPRLIPEISFADLLHDLRQQKRQFEQPTAAVASYTSKEHAFRDLLHSGHYPLLREIADLWCAVWFWDEGLPPTTLEYRDTINAIRGTGATSPRIDRIRTAAARIATREHFFHWELEFPEIFMRDNPGYDALCGNPPWETVKPNSDEFFEVYDPDFRERGKQEKLRVQERIMLELPEVAQDWLDYQHSLESQAGVFNSETFYQHQGRGDINTYKLFVERFYSIQRQGGYFGMIVPSGIYTDLGSMEIRQLFLNSGRVQYLFCFSNEKFIFPNVHHAFKFTLLGFSRGEQAETLTVAFRINPREAITAEQLPTFITTPENLIEMPIQAVRRFSPDSLSIMEFKSQRDADIAATIYDGHPLLGEEVDGAWAVRFTREFDMTNDSHLFNEEGRGLPLYEGKMIHHFNAFFASASYWVDEIEGQKEAGNNYQNARLGIRAVARSTDERTLVCSIVLPNAFCGNSLLIETDLSMSDAERFYVQSALSSLIIDYILRQKVSANVNMFYLYQLPVPRLTIGNPYFEALVPRAARLTCTRPEFADLWQSVMGSAWDESQGATAPDERQTLRHEIDALVAHLYGLNREDFAHILHTFPLVFPPDAAGQAKMARLLDEYDRWADVVNEWARG